MPLKRRQARATGLSFDTIVPPLLLTAIVTRKTAGRGSSGGKMQEALTGVCERV